MFLADNPRMHKGEKRSSSDDDQGLQELEAAGTVPPSLADLEVSQPRWEDVLQQLWHKLCALCSRGQLVPGQGATSPGPDQHHAWSGQGQTQCNCRLCDQLNCMLSQVMSLTSLCTWLVQQVPVAIAFNNTKWHQDGRSGWSP